MLTLILLPGMDGTGRLFEPFIRALAAAEKVQVIAYPVDIPMGYEELRVFVKAALPEGEPYVLLAESFAGPIAIDLAAAGGSQLRGLILCCTFARNPRPGLAWTEFLFGLIPISCVPNFVMSYFLLGRFKSGIQRNAISDAVAQVAPLVMRVRISAVIAVDVSVQMAHIRIPCLYLRAKHDRVVSPDAFEHIQRLLPSARECVIDGPHCLLQAAPNDSARVVKVFLQGVETATCDSGL